MSNLYTNTYAYPYAFVDPNFVRADIAPDVVDSMNELIEINNDSVKGAHTAMENLDESSALYAVFSNLVNQRHTFARELANYVVDKNGEPDEYGSLKGYAHRAWMDIKAMFSSTDDVAMLEEAERAEDKILHQYEDVLERGLPSEVHEMVQRQYETVKETHDTIRDLRDTYKVAKG